MNVLQIGDNDIIGNKFNGHDLHIYLRNEGVIANHLVMSKQSSDKDTYVFPSVQPHHFFNALVSQRVFLEADIIHLHLIHNTQFNIVYLPFISSLKPVVWTLHDPWVLSGHCIHHGNCDKWKSHCMDCNSLEAHFPLSRDTSALEFALKKRAIQNSQIFPIVASQWMEEKLAESPIWQGKPVRQIPFGINQSLFSPGDKLEARKLLGISANSIVLFCRVAPFWKGTDLLNDALIEAGKKNDLVLLTVGFAEKDILRHLPRSIRHVHYGWIEDDNSLLNLYRASDLFLMPSEQEAFGMMAIEAMSCGKMVLALDAPGSAVPQVINAPYSGIAVQRSQYAQELCRLLASPDEIFQRGKMCFSYATRKYGYKNYISKILSMYSYALENFSSNIDADLILNQLRTYACDESHSDLSFKLGEDGCILGCSKCRVENTSARLVSYYRKNGLLCTFKKIVNKILSD